ncbi:MAG TPA: cyclopropane-fatty-acyl-phospholipid synthase family protein [Acidimicrobiales bacterium]
MLDVAETLEPLVKAWLPRDLPVGITFWDGSRLGPAEGDATIVVKSPTALRRIIWSPNELGLGRAFVSGDIDLEGDVFAALEIRKAVAAPDAMSLTLGPRDWVRAVSAARRLGVLGRPLAPPPSEARARGRLHTRRRDSQVISHHYDVGNDFYALFLGSTMTYSCAYFVDGFDETDLDSAQEAKYDLICRKLGLEPGMRLLDIGCGWGGMVRYAARHYGVDAVGVTISQAQADYGLKRTADEGLGTRVEIRVQDYRDVADGPFDAVSSIGMFEHVGMARLGDYFGRLHELLAPTGRLLNHAISRPWNDDRSRFDRHSFISNYVFPDGELQEVGAVVTAMQQHGFEVRDVESLREHYAATLRRWVANLESSWDNAVELVGPARARIWRLYMAASALNFEDDHTQIHQVLGVRTAPSGDAAFPATRRQWLE